MRSAGLWMLWLAGCGEPVSGFVWDVGLTTAVDECNEPDVAYQERFDYVLNFDGGDVTVGLGNEIFATGRISGCTIDYGSVVWSEMVSGNEVRWRLTGTAQYRQSPGSCNLDPGVDWLGVETFEIVSSDDPDLEPGCQYILDVEGTYVGEAS